MPAIWALQLLLGTVIMCGVAVGPAQACRSGRHYDFVIKEADYTRLCHRKSILTVNGQFPGPTIYARKGDVVAVNVRNHGDKNITIHWHGVKQPRNPWSDGPEFITQCPIQPGANFTYQIIFTEEEGTLWWHAHSDLDRDTVHGAIVIRPRRGTSYPFKKPHKEIPILLGEWWKSDFRQVLADALRTGGEFQASDANTINGQPGDLLPCSRDGTFKVPVEDGKTYMLHLINAALTYALFFSVAGHSLTVVGTDGSYVKPFSVDQIFIAPGQTVTALLTADRASRGLRNSRYYMTARPLLPTSPLVLKFVRFDNNTATAVLEYTDDAAPSCGCGCGAAPRPEFPVRPAISDSAAADAYTSRLRSLASEEHPANVPRQVQEHMLITIAVNLIPCSPDEHCQGAHGERYSASLNNVSFETPRHGNILDAYFHKAIGVDTADFPSNPPMLFNFTADDLPQEFSQSRRGTKVKVVEYGTVVEVVFQDTAILGTDSHPMHLHGFSFYVVGRGLGNFDKDKDPATYNLVDPPYQNTVVVPDGGWAAIRFRAKNPGVWFMHCHVARHMVWGMDTVLIVKDGNAPEAKMLPPPPGMPRC